MFTDAYCLDVFHRARSSFQTVVGSFVHCSSFQCRSRLPVGELDSNMACLRTVIEVNWQIALSQMISRTSSRRRTECHHTCHIQPHSAVPFQALHRRRPRSHVSICSRNVRRLYVNGRSPLPSMHRLVLRVRHVHAGAHHHQLPRHQHRP